ncbi:MAG: heme-binding protein [Planctomycetota bacterium]
MLKLRPAVAALLVAAAPLVAADETEPAEPATSEQAETSDAAPEPYVAEASLPEGFPMPGPADAVSLKTYPTYRVALADGSNAFWKLFGHIQRHDIPMTAPVTMSNTSSDTVALDDGDQPVLDRADMTMGFLYPATSVGDLGPDTADGSVTVLDTEPMTVLSYGFFGPPRETRLAEARTAIEANLQADHPDLTFAGPWRLLGYNGPSVPADRRYYEVQRPVEAKTDTAPAEAENDAPPPASPED